MRSLAALLLAAVATSAATAAPTPGFLSTQGNQFVDSQGAKVKLTCVGWPGANYGGGVPDGLNATTYAAILDEAKAMGFNCIRFTWSDDALNVTADQLAASQLVVRNDDLAGKSALEVWDTVIAYGRSIGLKFVMARMWQNGNLDAFSSSGTAQTSLPYDTTGYCAWLKKNRFPVCATSAQVQADLVAVATRYKGNDAVIGIELWNEVNDNPSTTDYAHNNEGASTWGTGSATDLKRLATTWGNAVLKANPDVVVMVQGMQTFSTHAKLIQSDLSMVTAQPVKLARPGKLAYTFHQYPQYQGSDTRPHWTAADYMTQFGNAWNAGLPVWCSEMGVSGNYLDGHDGWLADYQAFLAFLTGASGGLVVPAGSQGVGWEAWALDTTDRFSYDPFDLLGPNWPETKPWDPSIDPNAPMLAPLRPSMSTTPL